MKKEWVAIAITQEHSLEEILNKITVSLAVSQLIHGSSILLQ